MIRHEVLKSQSRRRVRALFRRLWPRELRDRWPKWMRDAIDQAELLAVESYEDGFSDAVAEVQEMLTNFGRR